MPEEGLCEWVPAENVLARVDAAVAFIDALRAGITPVAAWPSKELDARTHMEDADDV